ncbi:Urocanate hydratase, partial [Periplaneta americana]
ITVLNAGRKHLGAGSLAGKVFVTSGLGGMSGAQPKAAVIAGCIGVVAEVSREALEKRHAQGWLQEIESNLDNIIQRIRAAKKGKQAVSIGYHGNVVKLWERLVQEYERTGELLVDLGSDQTSCHNPFNGGYYPVQLDYEQAQEVLARDPALFKELVQASLVRQVAAINFLAERGMFFWDYGNAFLLEARRAGAEVGVDEDPSGLKFRYPSYVQDIMGDIFSLGFGPFRWVCTSGTSEDLEVTDRLATEVIENILSEGVSEMVEAQYLDNLRWIREAGRHQLVVGSQARILYSDRVGRIRLALKFNEAVRDGSIKAPVVMSRDHHDVSGTDSPFRETSNISDGSAFTADMAVQNCIGDSFRGATWVALHNGGGVGWGEVINGGFGMLLDGSEEAASRAALMLGWDVSNGVARRCWSGNQNARMATQKAMQDDALLLVTLPHEVDSEDMLKDLIPS